MTRDLRLTPLAAWHLLEPFVAELQAQSWRMSPVLVPSASHPFRRNCAALELAPEMASGVSVGLVREFLDVWALLACCRHAGERPSDDDASSNTARFWRELLELMADAWYDRKLSAVMQGVEATATFPRFVLARALGPLESVRAALHGYRALLAWNASSCAPSYFYSAALHDLAPFVDPERRAIAQVRITLCMPWNSMENQTVLLNMIDTFLTDLKASPPGQGALPFVVDRIELHHGFIVRDSAYVRHLERLLRDHDTLVGPALRFQAAEARERVDGRPAGRWANANNSLRRAVGPLVMTCLSREKQNSTDYVVVSVASMAELHSWMATCVCSVLRSLGTTPGDEVALEVTGISSVVDLCWVVYGLIGSSVTRLKLTLFDDEDGVEAMEDAMDAIHELATSTMPTRVLLALHDRDLVTLAGLQYLEPGTMAMLATSTFSIKWRVIRRAEDTAVGHGLEVKLAQACEVEVLALTPDLAGVLVPGVGFGWIPQTVLLNVHESMSKRCGKNAGIADLRLKAPELSRLPVLLNIIGSEVKSLGIANTRNSPDIAASVGAIMGSCPLLCSLKSSHLNVEALPVVMESFGNGGGSLKTLTCMLPGSWQDDHVLRHPLVMALCDNDHPLSRNLENICVRASLESGADAHALDMAMDTILRCNRRLKRVDCVGTQVLRHRYVNSTLQDHHPLFGFLGLRSKSHRHNEPLEAFIRRFDRVVLETIYEFVGANRLVTVRCNVSAARWDSDMSSVASESSSESSSSSGDAEDNDDDDESVDSNPTWATGSDGSDAD